MMHRLFTNYTTRRDLLSLLGTETFVIRMLHGIISSTGFFLRLKDWDTGIILLCGKMMGKKLGVLASLNVTDWM